MRLGEFLFSLQDKTKRLLQSYAVGFQPFCPPDLLFFNHPNSGSFSLFFESDIDECSRGIHGCHHNCRNVPGSYFCSCQRGFRLSDDLKTCVGE